MRELRGCTGKIRHDSRRDARRARRTTYVAKGVHLQAYRCVHCTGWHLGSVPTPVVRGWVSKAVLLWQ